MTWESQAEPEFRWSTWMDRSPAAAGLIARLEPPEGWAAVPLTVAMCTLVGWSLADAKWVIGNDQYTGFLIWVAMLAALWGWVSARLIPRRWLAHLLGAMVAAIILPVFVGYAIDPTAADPKAAYDATGNAVMKAYLDLIWYRFLTTQQVGHFSLFLAIFVWSTSQMASYSVFGHHRPINAVLLLAVVFVGNMALTINDQFVGLVLFSAVALALLLQSHAADERTAWLRHRIWRPHETQVPHLRGGMAFAGIAVSASLLFTGVASSAPLAGVWPEVTDNFRELADQLVRFLPPSQTGRFNTPGDFGTTAPILTSWHPQDQVEFQIQGQDAKSSYHWRMIAYDYFSKNGWQLSDPQSKAAIGAGADIASGTQDEATQTGRTQRRFTITLIDKGIRQLIAPNEPLSVSVDVTENRIGTGTTARNSFATTSASSYVVTALVPSLDATGSGVTENKLRAAGTDYPPGLKAAYTQGVEFLGPDASNLNQTILALQTDHPLNNPYDIAKAIEVYLSTTGPFSYQTDLSPYQSQCVGLSTADCFARVKVGFCQQFATTMAMLLRLDGIPARYVQGYLPTTPDPHTYIQNVSKAQQHAWVEVYFPGYGWIEFDPTRKVGQPAKIPPGAAVSPKPSASASAAAAEPTDPRRTLNPHPAPGNTETPGDNTPTTAVIGGTLSVAGIALIWLLWLRRSRKIETPDQVYRSLTKTASLLGYKPQPTQTVYEYVGTLSGVMPRSTPHLETVASAKVEVTYGRRVLAGDRLRRLAVARNKLRMAFMRLAIRRPPIPFLHRKRRK